MDTIENTYHQLALADENHHIHPFSNYAKPSPSTLICHSQGVYVTDHLGNKMLDGIAGLWCVNVGHGRSEIANAMAKQATEMAYYSPFGNLGSPPAARLTQKLISLAPPNINHVLYSCGGSTANDVAISLIHFYQNQRGLVNKKLILSRQEAYHGMTYVAASLTGIEWNNWGFDTVDFVRHISQANVYKKPHPQMSDAEYCDWLCADFEKAVEDNGAHNIAAFIAEPIMGAGGVLVAPEGYHKRIKDLCERFDILFISDEVVTAFGRLGEWFASDTIFGFEPDIIISAKGLTSGYAPLGATLICDKIFDVISKPQCEGGMLSRGFTYSAHPVSCAAALENIAIIEREGIMENVQRVGPYLREQLDSLREFDIVGDVRGMHFMQGIEYVVPEGVAKTMAELSPSTLISAHCQDNGLMIRPVGHHLNVISPPLIWSEEEVDLAVGLLRRGIRYAEQSL